MATILVTGANGFVGRHVSRIAAREGHEVVGIGHGDWMEDSWRDWGLSAWHELDVTLASLLAHGGQPTIVIHCAGGSSVGFSFENPAQDFDRTVGTTRDVLEYLRISAPESALVYPSSAAVYGRAAALPLTEDSQLAPISPYGAHKLMAEGLCRSYAETYSLRVAIVRLFSAYGAELRKQLLWDACLKVSAGDLRFAGTGKQTRDWVHVEDAAHLLLLAGQHASAEAPTANGASGEEVSIEKVLRVVFDALGADGRPEFTGTARAGDPERYVGDSARARSWGWEPQWPWERGVREYARWFRDLAG